MTHARHDVTFPADVIIDGIHYRRHEVGAIEQLDPKPFTYDRSYIATRYDTYAAEQLAAMSHLRLGLLLASAGYVRGPLLDYGYGNGAFLRAARGVFSGAYGYEVNGYGAPDGCGTVTDPTAFPGVFSVVTMFDVLEHLPQPDVVIQSLRPEVLMVTVPFCYAETLGAEWFRTWKHRRPHEHIWHFSAPALCRFLSHQCGYQVEYMGSPEDVIRGSLDGRPNTVTVIARRSDA